MSNKTVFVIVVEDGDYVGVALSLKETKQIIRDLKKVEKKRKFLYIELDVLQPKEM